MSRLHPRLHVLLWLLLAALALGCLAVLLPSPSRTLPAVALQDEGQEQARMATLLTDLRNMQARVQARQQALGGQVYSRTVLLPEYKPNPQSAAAQARAVLDGGMALLHSRGDQRMGALLGEQVVHVGDVLGDGARVVGISAAGIKLRQGNGELRTIKAYGNFSPGSSPPKERAP